MLITQARLPRLDTMNSRTYLQTASVSANKKQLPFRHDQHVNAGALGINAGALGPPRRSALLHSPKHIGRVLPPLEHNSVDVTNWFDAIENGTL